MSEDRQDKIDTGSSDRYEKMNKETGGREKTEDRHRQKGKRRMRHIKEDGMQGGKEEKRKN